MLAWEVENIGFQKGRMMVYVPETITRRRSEGLNFSPGRALAGERQVLSVSRSLSPQHIALEKVGCGHW